MENYERALFGPSGHSESFAQAGMTATLDMPRWLSERGLELFEYSFGRGVRITTAKAEEIAHEAAKYGIEMSAHAPYFINFATTESDKAENSIRYLLTSLKVLRAFGGKRCVFHAGAEGSQPRCEAMARIMDILPRLAAEIESGGYSDIIVCPETMGKQAQIGTVDEIIEMCKLAPNFYPCLDFGHINALGCGCLKTVDDYQRIIDKLFDNLGEIKTKNMHVHFSKIQFGVKGEIRHLTFADCEYGPEFEPFAEAMVKNRLTPHVLSESAGTQAEDAALMKKLYSEALDPKRSIIL